MKIITKTLCAFLLGLGLLTVSSFAFGEDADITMNVMARDASEFNMHTISLPDPASEQARKSAEFGIDTANAARERAKERQTELNDRREERRLDQEERREAARERAAEGRSNRGRGRPESPGKPN